MASTSHNNCTDNLISSFTASLKSDLDSPVTSNFGNHIADYHTQVQNIAEQIENDASEFERLRKISKDIEDGIGTLAKQLNAFAQVSKELAEKWTTKSENDTESDAAIALLKMELFMRNESELMNGQLRNWHNNMVHPLDLLVKSPNELKIKNVDKACREYDSKFVKTENETRKIAKQCGYTRSQLSHGELAEQLSKERIFVEYELCKFMLGADSFEDKRGAQLFRHFMELFRSQDIYYKERLKLNEHFRSDLERLEERMQARNATRCQQRNALFDLKTRLETHSEIIRNASGNRQMSRADSLLNRSSLSQSTISGSTDKSKQKLISSSANKTAQSQSNGSNADKSMLNQSAHHKVALTPMNQVPLNMSTSVHQQQQQQSSNDERIDLNGYLFKKTNNKLHKLWQKRRCRLHDGYFCISHSDESLAPVRMDLRISDCKPSADDPKAFDFYCRDRTYHLQAETEALLQQWILALKQEMERVKSKMLTSDDQTSSSVWLNQNASTERDMNDQLCINSLKALPGNLRCADCSSTKQVEWLSNIGSLVCIACSGVHRELGVHISRIHSIDLDVISAVEYLVPLATGNTLINRIFEYNETSCAQWKPTAECTRSDRQRFIQYKYRDRCYIEKVEQADRLFCDALRELDVEKAYRALLSPSLTSLPFEVNGPFQTLIQKTKPMSLVIAQLVVQLRIGLPSLESILVDCVNNANIDLLIILLQSHAFNSLLSNGFSLEPLERLAHKLGHHNIVELLCSVQSPERTLFKQFTIPASLISQASQSDSLSASSSSSSHLPNTNAEVDSIATNEQNSAQIDVLMRNGTTIPVERGIKHFGSVRSTRSISPVKKPPQHSAIRNSAFVMQPASTSIANNQFNEYSSFRGSTFGKSLNDGGGNHLNSNDSAAPFPKSIRFHRNTADTLDAVSPLVTNVQRTNSSSLIDLSPHKEQLMAANSLKITTSSSSNETTSISHSMLSGQESPASGVKNERRSAVNEDDRRRKLELQRELLMRSKMSGVQSIDERTITEGSSSLDMQRNEHIKEMNVAEHRPAQALTAFESARASFMSASERAARYSLGGANTSSLSAYNSGYEKPTNYQHHHQKTNSADDNHNNSVLLPSSSSTPFYNNNNNVNDPAKKPTTPRIIRPAPPPPPLAQTGLKLKPPIPVPRKPGTSGETNQKECTRRCKALYDCIADSTDELSFRQGDIIIVTKERIAGEYDTWMEGYLARDPQHKGIFPVTFVTFQS